MNTRYWQRKKDYFANKCEVQESRQDGRIYREWTNPQTGEHGGTWEYQWTGFKGLIEYVDLKEGLYGGWDFYLGLTGEKEVNVLVFKVFTAKNEIVDTLISLIRKVTNLRSDVPLTVGLYTPNPKDQYPKTYTTLKQDGKNVPDGFEKDPGREYGHIGIPNIEVKEGVAGKKIYDKTKRDTVLFDHLKEFVEDRKDDFEKNKKLRPATTAEGSYVNAVDNLPTEQREEEEEEMF